MTVHDTSVPTSPDVSRAGSSPSTTAVGSPSTSPLLPPPLRISTADQLELRAAPLSPTAPPHTHSCCPAAPVYVLAQDGQAYVVDGSKAPGHEDPPPYAPLAGGGRTRSASLGARPVAHAYVPLSPRRGYGATAWEGSPVRDDGGAESRTAEGFWAGLRAVLCGEEGDGGRIALADDEWGVATTPATSAWGRFWAPLTLKSYWYPLVHLICANFPFTLLVWPLLLAGTLTGTVLLITLPVGAVFWWLTLFLSRWAAREEIRMQQRYHGVGRGHHVRPIFYRLREVRPAPAPPYFPAADGVELVWDKRFLRNSWAMFCDNYSYSALVYFLLIKPVNIFVPTILLVVFFPICLALTPLLPIYLRAARRYGHFQANLAMTNL